MAGKRFGKLGGFVGSAVVLVAAAVGLWMERTRVLAWVHVRGLARAEEANRSRWVERVANLGETAVPFLIDLLKSHEAQPCRNARAALDRLAGQWGPDDPRTAALVHRLTQSFAQLSMAGQENAVLLAAGWLTENRAVSASLRAAVVSLVAASADCQEDVRSSALDLCSALLDQAKTDETLIAARALVRSCLQSAAPSLRVRAVKLTVVEGLDLAEQVVPLLRDSAPEVRGAAILAMGPADHLVRDESLLPCLHDPDPNVRRLCELALQARGLRPEHLQLGRLLTDPKPNVRLQVLDHLYLAGDLDPDLWLRRLSHDPSPAVRAGALRMMSQLAAVDLSDRIDQMSRNDPSPTVSELARFYLKGHRGASGASEP